MWVLNSFLLGGGAFAHQKKCPGVFPRGGRWSRLELTDTLHAGHGFSNMIGNLLLLLFNYLLLSLIILNARLAVLERPNRSIDQVHNATFPWFSPSK